MFKIEYNLKENNTLNASIVDEAELRYTLFPGNIILKSEHNLILMDWEWIPVLDFAICLLEICNNLMQNEVGINEFEFTESNEKLILQKDYNRIRIVPTFLDKVIETTFEEFKIEVERFYTDIIFVILSGNKELNHNKVFRQYLDEAERISNTKRFPRAG